MVEESVTVEEELAEVQQIFVTKICLFTAELLSQEGVVGLDISHQLVAEVMEVMGVAVAQETAVAPQIVQAVEAILQ